MRIQHNIVALRICGRLKTIERALSKNITRLSSGYRINSAADDPAGFAVSERMRAQINGLKQAEENAQNGISMIQTAEGGLNETSSILQRMNTLAVESANGTYRNDTDRANLQKEYNALRSEINTIAGSTDYNQISLLNGSLGDASLSGLTGLSASGISGISVTGGHDLKGTGIAAAYTAASNTLTVSLSPPAAGISFTADGASFAAGGTYTFRSVVNAAQATAEDAGKYSGMEIAVTLGGTSADTSASATLSGNSGGLILQTGPDNRDDQRVRLSIENMSADSLGLGTSSIATQYDAERAIDSVKAALNKVNSARADLGARQEALEFSIDNLSTMGENLTEAESRIRDVDFAEEYADYAKNLILSKVATAMLAQSNSLPDSILELLQSR